tara:strand:- start:1000 stop:1449 length:450 start_codon:yes stop_codon:yes gene_type:complete
LKVNVYKVRETAKIPVRSYDTDAGMDLFFCPEQRSPISIEPGQSVLLGTGLKIQVPINHMLQVMNKSGIASKKQLIAGACVVDEGYDGEIFVNLQNIGKQTTLIEPDQKIAQGVFVRIQRPDLYEIRQDNIYGQETSRGSGALGSTGNF